MSEFFDEPTTTTTTNTIKFHHDAKTRYQGCRCSSCRKPSARNIPVLCIVEKKKHDSRYAKELFIYTNISGLVQVYELFGSCGITGKISFFHYTYQSATALLHMLMTLLSCADTYKNVYLYNSENGGALQSAKHFLDVDESLSGIISNIASEHTVITESELRNYVSGLCVSVATSAAAV